MKARIDPAFFWSESGVLVSVLRFRARAADEGPPNPGTARVTAGRLWPFVWPRRPASGQSLRAQAVSDQAAHPARRRNSLRGACLLDPPLRAQVGPLVLARASILIPRTHFILYACLPNSTPASSRGPATPLRRPLRTGRVCSAATRRRPGARRAAPKPRIRVLWRDSDGETRRLC